MKDIFKAALCMLGFFILLPALYACIIAFKAQCITLPSLKQWGLYSGALLFLGIYLFIYDGKQVFEWTLNAMSKVFAFTGSLSTIIGYLIPLYVIATIVIHLILIVLEKSAGFEGLLLSTLGFFLTMHTVLSAKHLYDGDSSLLKSNYLCVYSLLFLTQLIIAALLLNWALGDFNSWQYLTNAAQLIKSTYMSLYRLLFVP